MVWFIDLIISTALGGGVGWITNYIAINMLFRKYWKWGGVIEEKYQEFIDSMSRLVEEDLVNGDTLKTEFESEAFKQVLQEWVEDIIKTELPANSGTKKLEDIPGIEKSIDSLLSLIEDIEPPLMNGIYKALSSQKIPALISGAQYEYIVQTNLANIFKDKQKYENNIQTALGVFLDGKTINTLISSAAVREISNNIAAIIEKIDIKKYDSNINTSFEELIVALKVDGLIVELQDRLGKMRLADFVGNRQEALSRELLTKILDFVKSNEGQSLLREIIGDFINEAKKVNLKISDVVSPDIQSGIVRFFREKMPDIIERIISIIRQNQSEIEYMVNTTVDRVLERGGFFDKVIKFFKDTFIKNFAGQVGVVKRITEEVDKYGNEASEKLSSGLLDMLQTKTIGEIVSMIESSGFAIAEGIVELVNRNLNELPRQNIGFIDNLLQKEIGKTFGGINLSIIKDKALPIVLEKIKSECLYNERFKTETGRTAKEKIQQIAEKSLSDFFDVYKVPITLEENKIKTALLGYWETLSKMKFQDLIGSDIPKELFIQKETFKRVWDEQKERPLGDIYSAIQNEAIYKKAADGLIDLVLENLDGLLGNHIAPIVNTELSKLEPSKINDMVQDFMGKEMKFINIFGAVLGAIVGFGSALVVHFMKLPSSFMWQIFLAYGIVFAGVGIGTNWLAIKMLFRPYKGLFGINKIPFIGVVAANKPRFAANIGNFVKERMLNENALHNFFESNKLAAQNKLFNRISDSEYAVIDNLMENDERLTNISQYIYYAIKKYLVDNRKELSNSLSDKLKELVKDGSLYDVLPKLQNLIIEKLKQADVVVMLTTYIEKEISGKNLGGYKKLIESFSDTQLKNIFQNILQNLNREITLEKVKKIIGEQNDAFTDYVENHSIEDFAGATVIEGLKDKIAPEIGPMLKKGIKPLINSLQREGLNPNTKLSDLFGGALKTLIDNNIPLIIEWICRDFSAKKGSITEKIKTELPSIAFFAKDKVAPVVEELIDIELPKFLRRKESEFVNIAKNLLENRLSDLGFTNNSLQIDRIESTITAIIDSQHFVSAIAFAAGTFIKSLVKLPVGTLLNIISINNINDIVRRIEPLLETAVNHIKDNLEREEVLEVIARLVNSVLLDVIASVKLRDLFSNIELEKEIRNLVNLLKADDKVISELKYIVSDVLETIGNNPHFFDGAILSNDTAAFIAAPEFSEVWNDLEPFALSAMKECFKQLNSRLNSETKNALINEYLISAAIESCVKLLPEIMKILNVEKVVEREVNNMQPAEIEKLFDKFAHTYFKKIIFYGWIGVFGGLVSYVVSRFIK